MPKNFSDIFSRYKTYDDSYGRGSVKEWREAFDSTMNIDDARKAIKKTNPLVILGFDQMPDIDELNSTYRDLMKIHHPDKGGDPSIAKKIIAAYTLLKDQIDF